MADGRQQAEGWNKWRMSISLHGFGCKWKLWGQGQQRLAATFVMSTCFMEGEAEGRRRVIKWTRMFVRKEIFLGRLEPSKVTPTHPLSI